MLPTISLHRVLVFVGKISEQLTFFWRKRGFGESPRQAQMWHEVLAFELLAKPLLCYNEGACFVIEL